MTVFIVFASGQVDAAIINCLCGPESLDLIGYAKNAADALIRIVESRPELVIIDSRYAEIAALTVLRDLQGLALVSIILVTPGSAILASDQVKSTEQVTHLFQFPDEGETLRATLSTLGASEMPFNPANQTLTRLKSNRVGDNSHRAKPHRSDDSPSSVQLTCSKR
jgi:chemotaxis response regulator CheB